MQHFISSIMATISLVTLALYDFLCICKIIKKEQFIEKIWKHFVSDKWYNEAIVFLAIRPMLLFTSSITFIFSGEILIRIPIFIILLVATPLLTIIYFMRIIVR